ncbi:probable membrane-associated kinase regulator 6 [Punica granatum]|uniref:Uncharacterized protein n=2 Tax=Punica granatum TaxID=22663 RepID=A0A2I0J798_PUNGR|nr:probable membrane-associated kinase regulator 6 [Punica granatum]PKI52104.1 hypothetical protein CRG98_027520 [Punica granatum]
MEDVSQLLSLESFSYRWLVDQKTSKESRGNSLRASLDVSDEGSFIEMDPRSPPSKRFIGRIKSNSLDFKFDFPVLQSPASLVPADKLFAEGFVLPLFADPSSMEAFQCSDLQPELHLTKPVVSGSKARPVSLSSRRRNRRLSVSRRFFCKYLSFLRPLYLIVIRGGTRKTRATKNSVYPADDSPKTSCAYSVDDWRHSSADSESSIYEAVLHCKRSIGQ